MFNTVLKWMIAGSIICGGIVSVNAGGIALDGSMGTSGALTGPDFQIKAEYGRQAGTNLFHSFAAFNVQANESAAFSGPESVQNIISRVTGGETSKIDGLIRSTIAGANLLLINPAGVFFGPEAFVDVSGSFYISSADYVRLGNDRFYALPIENEILSAASPVAFGFFDLSLPLDNYPQSVPDTTSGQAQIVEAGSTGEINISQPFFHSPNRGVSFEEQSMINSSAVNKERVMLRGGHFYTTSLTQAEASETNRRSERNPCCPDDTNDT